MSEQNQNRVMLKYGTHEEYESLQTHNSSTIYFTTNPERIYKGDILYTPTTAELIQYSEEYPTVRDALDRLLYVSPRITSFSTNPSQVEIGSIVNSVTLRWSTNKDLTLSLNNNIGTVTGTSYNFNTTLTSTRTFRLTGTDGTNTVTASASISFLPRMFWFASSAISLSRDSILRNSGTSSLVSSVSSTYVTKTFNCTGGRYIYFCIPTSMVGNIEFVAEGLVTTFIESDLSDFTNQQEATVPMKIFRSLEMQTGSNIKIQIRSK